MELFLYFSQKQENKNNAAIADTGKAWSGDASKKQGFQVIIIAFIYCYMPSKSACLSTIKYVYKLLFYIQYIYLPSIFNIYFQT